MTGARDQVADGARDLVERIRRVTGLPVALGFGHRRDPEHVADVGRYADAAVVGSALVAVIARDGRDARTGDDGSALRALAEQETSWWARARRDGRPSR